MLLLRLQYNIVDTTLLALWTNKCVKAENGVKGPVEAVQCLQCEALALLELEEG